jgi:hypothetical protein
VVKEHTPGVTACFPGQAGLRSAEQEIVPAETMRGSLEERDTSDYGLLSPLPTDKPRRDRV